MDNTTLLLTRILNNIKSLKADISGKLMTKETFEIYLEMLNKDLNSLGNLIRENRNCIRSLEKENDEQNLQQTALSTKVGVIIGIVGGLGGIGSILFILLKKVVS